MLLRHRGREPAVDPSAFVAPTATLVGDVRVGPRARVMYGAVLDAEASRVEVGECAIVCERHPEQSHEGRVAGVRPDAAPRRSALPEMRERTVRARRRR